MSSRVGGARAAVVVAIGLVLAATGCVRDSYFCELDSDCDAGTAGRCETDHRCTALDDNCPTRRRYTSHSGDQSGQCYAGTAELANACMGGQPPAIADGCAGDVCELLPSCCVSGWTNACAAQAQITCPEQACSTTIAVTASSLDGTHAELWELAWTGEGWEARPQPADGVWFGYAAPAPGTVAPRKMAITLDAAFSLVVDGRAPISLAARRYVEATSVDFDRDRRDTVALTWTDFGVPPRVGGVELLHLDDLTDRDIESAGLISGLEWGAYDDDAFPDAAAGKGVAVNPGQYTFLHSAPAGDGLAYLLDPLAGSNFTMPTAPATRSMQWADLDGDEVMDLVAFGSNARVHLSKGNPHVSDTQAVAFDCSPIHAAPFSKTTCGETEPTDLVGTVVITGTTPRIVLGDTTTQELFRIDDVTSSDPVVTQILKCPSVGGIEAAFAFAPAPAAACLPFLAVVARDLDHDGAMDLVAIDTQLRVFTSRDGGKSFAIETPVGADHPAVELVRTAIAGEPAP